MYMKKNQTIDVQLISLKNLNISMLAASIFQISISHISHVFLHLSFSTLKLDDMFKHWLFYVAQYFHKICTTLK